MKLKKMYTVVSFFLVLPLVFGLQIVYAESDPSTLIEQNEVKNTTQNASEQSQLTEHPSSVVEYKTCVKSTSLNRENAMLFGWNSFTDAMTQAYTARRDTIAGVITSTDSKDGMQKAMIDAERSFGQASVKAQKTWKETQRKAFKQFQEDRKKCAPKKTAVSNLKRESATENGMIKGIEQKSGGMIERPTVSENIDGIMFKKIEGQR